MSGLLDGSTASTRKHPAPSPAPTNAAEASDFAKVTLRSSGTSSALYFWKYSARTSPSTSGAFD
jgi:hypothetical protein